jgi:diadenosine tetraphosphate (Ap4A) HIT family hydrolase/DNA-binding XRE family transcriptional regulator
MGKSSNLLARKIGVRIRDLRIKRELTQEKLGELSGLDHKHIQRLESPRTVNPRIDTIESIVKAFQMSLEDFFADSIFEETKVNLSNKKINLSRFKSPPIPRKKIEEDEYSYAIYEQDYVTRGHILVFLKREIKDYFEALPEEKQSLWFMIEKVKKFLDKEYKPDGYNIGFNLGEAAGQVGDHFYFEIIPRYKGDMRNPEGGIRGVIPARQKF